MNPNSHLAKCGYHLIAVISCFLLAGPGGLQVVRIYPRKRVAYKDAWVDYQTLAHSIQRQGIVVILADTAQLFSPSEQLFKA